MLYKKVFLSLLLLLYPSLAACETLSELLTQTRIFLRDTDTSSSRQQFTDSQLTSFLNDGQKDINSRTWCLIKNKNICLRTYHILYTLPEDYQMTFRVTVSSKAIIERTRSFLDDSNKNWIEETGTPTEYYIKTATSPVTGTLKTYIGVHPISTMTVIMNVEYLSQTSDLITPTDIPFLSYKPMYPYHGALTFFAAYKGFMSMGLLEEAMLYKKDYEDDVKLIEGMMGTRHQFNPNYKTGVIQNQIQTQNK